MDGLVQDCGISIASAMEIPQFCIHSAIDITLWQIMYDFANVAFPLHQCQFII